MPGIVLSFQRRDQAAVGLAEQFRIARNAAITQYNTERFQ